MRAFFMQIFIFIFGGLFYGLIEIAFRGFTHWSMLIAGGICCIILYLIAARTAWPLWQKCILGGMAITTVEFIVGIIVNVALGWSVWDYSNIPMNFMGQICPLFSLIWTALSVPAIFIFSAADKFVRNR